MVSHSDKSVSVSVQSQQQRHTPFLCWGSATFLGALLRSQGTCTPSPTGTPETAHLPRWAWVIGHSSLPQICFSRGLVLLLCSSFLPSIVSVPWFVFPHPKGASKNKSQEDFCYCCCFSVSCCYVSTLGSEHKILTFSIKETGHPELSAWALEHNIKIRLFFSGLVNDGSCCLWQPLSLSLGRKWERKSSYSLPWPTPWDILSIQTLSLWKVPNPQPPGNTAASDSVISAFIRTKIIH